MLPCSTIDEVENERRRFDFITLRLAQRIQGDAAGEVQGGVRARAGLEEADPRPNILAQADRTRDAQLGLCRCEVAKVQVQPIDPGEVHAAGLHTNDGLIFEILQREVSGVEPIARDA